MSSSMETNLLLSDTEPGPKTWKDIDQKKWRQKANGCQAKTGSGMCFITGDECDYEKCFGRYWGIL